MAEGNRLVFVAALIIAASACMTFAHIRMSPMGSANPKSRFSTIECLVEHGTYRIGCSAYKGTMDRVRYQKRLYSSKPPMLSTIAAAPHAVFHNVFGMTFEKNERFVVFSTIFLVVLLPQIAAMIFFWLISLELCPPKEALLSLLLFAFTWLGIGYATDLNNHTTGAAALLAAFYFLRKSTVKSAVAAGLLAGLLPTIDLSSAVFSLAIAAFMLARHRRQLGYFIAAALLPLIAHFALSYALFDSPLPAYLQHDLYERPLREWNSSIGIITYGFHALIGTHGLLTMTPAILLGIYGLIRAKEHRDFALTIAVPSAIVVLTYLVINRNYGGRAVGMRWYIILTAACLLFVGPALAALKTRAAHYIVLACLVVGGFHAQDAMQNPWFHSRWELLLTGQLQKWRIRDRAAVNKERAQKQRAKERR